MTVEVLERGLQATEIGKTHIHFQKRSISPFGSLLQLSTNSLAPFIRNLRLQSTSCFEMHIAKAP